VILPPVPRPPQEHGHNYTGDEDYLVSIALGLTLLTEELVVTIKNFRCAKCTHSFCLKHTRVVPYNLFMLYVTFVLLLTGFSNKIYYSQTYRPIW